TLEARRRGALTHAHHDGAVPQDENIAALGGGDSVEAAVRPPGKSMGRETGVPLIYSLVIDGFANPGVLAHGIDCQTVVDPGRGIARKQVVRQGSNHKIIWSHRANGYRRRFGGEP